MRKLKDGNGRPIFVPGYEQGNPGGAPDRLMGREIVINQHMPVMGANAKSILFGDFSKYLIRDVMDTTLFRMTDSAFTLKGLVGFVAFARSGANMIDVGGAIKYYQIVVGHGDGLAGGANLAGGRGGHDAAWLVDAGTDGMVAVMNTSDAQLQQIRDVGLDTEHRILNQLERQGNCLRRVFVHAHRSLTEGGRLADLAELIRVVAAIDGIERLADASPHKGHHRVAFVHSAGC